MIRVTHNGAQELLDPSDYSCVGEALEACTRDPDAGVPRVLVRLRVNQRDVPDDLWEDARAGSLDGVRELEIESRTPVELARRSLESAADYSRGVERALEGAAARLRRGEIAEGSELFSAVVDGLSVLTYAIRAARELLGRPAPGLEAIDAELEPRTQMLVEAQEAGDWLRTADLLEFELAPLVAGWRDAIGHVLPDGPSRPPA